MDFYVPPPSSADTAGKGLYASPDEALQKVINRYEYWTTKLTETSLQMCYGIIGGNWVVFGSVNGILRSDWAKWSIVLVVMALGSSVLGAWRLSESLGARAVYAEAHPQEWAQDYKESSGKDVPWPFTDAIQNTGKYMRWIKAGLTLGSGLLLIIGAILK